MKNWIIAVFLALTGLTAQAGDFVDYANQKPQNLPADSIQIINFWATWCKPCRTEMPEMSRWYSKTGKKNKVLMVGIALDSQDNIDKFLKTTPVNYPIWRYTGTNSRQMMREFGNTVGGLPYTVVRAPKCSHEEKIIGELTPARLDAALKSAKSACRKTPSR